jgi:hypothetical protein
MALAMTYKVEIESRMLLELRKNWQEKIFRSKHEIYFSRASNPLITI